MKTEPGEVWLADLGIAAKTRPVLILSRYDADPPRALVIYVPLTTKNRGSAYEVELGQLSFLNQPSVANVQGVTAVPTVRMERRLGRVTPEILEKVKSAVRFALEL